MPHPEDVTPSGLNGLDASASPASELGPVSPELALIDPELAAAARALLPDPAPAPVARPRAPAGPARPVEVAFEKLVAEAPVGAPRRRYRRLLTTGVPAVLGALVLALIVIVDWQDRGMPRLLEPTDALPSPTASAPKATSPPAGTTAWSATTPQPTTTARSATTPQPTTTAATEPAPETEPAGQTFVWAASAGAAAYEFQLFRGETRIFRTRVAEPRLQLPREWRDGGRDQSLEPGTYRWYVWPISESTQRRSRVATVQARLVIED